ncbi:galectin-4-like [Lineus longissimus]|uniref:galectin-4-like n=1 Tax=Lineus longissimus TaxID=88925 RepID=UPI00315D2BB0
MAYSGHALPGGAIYEIANPHMPYSGPVRGPLIHGSMIFIRGHIQQGCSRMVINLEAANGDIVLHINPRFNDGAIVRNTCQGNWGGEERSGGMPLQQGGQFECIILVQEGHYKIAFNGQHFTDYHHRMAKESVTLLKVDGDLRLNNITFQGVPQPPPYMGAPDPYARMCKMPEPSPGVPGFPYAMGKVAPPENPPQYGVPSYGTPAGQVPQPGGYAPPPSGGYAPPSCPSGGYAPPSKGGYAPPSGGYAPPSCPSGGYAPPSKGGYAPPSEVGNTPPSKGGYAPPSQPPYQPPGYGPAPVPGKPGPGGPPIYNPPVPFLGNLSGGMHAGRDVHISGIPNHGAQRFTVNFQCGQAGRNIPFHFDVRLNERCIVGNSMQKNAWGSEIRVHNVPFRPGQNFDLRIRCGPKKYKAFVANQLLMEFPHRILPTEKAVLLNITGDVRLTCQGPFAVDLPDGHMQHKNSVVIKGVPKDGAERFSVNLQCDHEAHDIPFHFDARLAYGNDNKVIIGNNKEGGSWCSEERCNDCPFEAGEPFTIKIKCGKAAYKVKVNDQKIMRFPYRVDKECVHTLSIDGDVILESVKA